MSDLDSQVGSNTKNVGVEGRVMQLAQRQPVRNNGVASRILVGEDVCCVEQLPMSQPAYGTRLFIGVQHSNSEERLVQALIHQHREVCAPWSIGQGGSRRCDVRDVLSEDR